MSSSFAGSVPNWAFAQESAKQPNTKPPIPKVAFVCILISNRSRASRR
jgi:hypothetical protein